MDKIKQHEFITAYHKTKQEKYLLTLIRSCEPYIQKLAGKHYKYFSQMVEFQDLVQECRIGLIKAVERFDVSKNYTLLTYATLWMKNEMFARWLQSLPVHIPAHTVRKFIYYDKPNRVNSYEKLQKVIETFPIHLLNDETREENIKIQKHSVNYTEDTFSKRVLDKTYVRALNKLTPLERDIFIGLSGVFDGSKYSQEDMMYQFNISQGECLNAYKRAKNKLKKSLLQDADAAADKEFKAA